MEKAELSAAIVLFHNPIEVLERTINSFFLSPSGTRLYLFDNSSNEDLRIVSDNDPRITYYSTASNLGFGRAHNLVLSRFKGETKYHLVLNPDVDIHPGTLDKLIGFMETHPDVGLVSPRILNPNGSIQHLNKLDPTFFDLFVRRFLPTSLYRFFPAIENRHNRYIMLDKGYEKIVDVSYLSGCFMLFRREVFEQIGGFDERFFLHLEDADITRRARQIARTVFNPDAEITHLWQRGSHHSVKQTFITLYSAYLYFSKWGWRFA